MIVLNKLLEEIELYQYKKIRENEKEAIKMRRETEKLLLSLK
jgi:hypothetical protein